MTIRIATQNVWGRMPLWSLRKRAMAHGLASADVVVLQEVQARGKRSQAHDLAHAMGLEHALFATAGRTLWWREGIGIISRWPVVDAAWEKLPQDPRNLVDRIAPRLVMRMVVEIPEGRLEIYAVHLSLSKAARTRAGKAVAAFAARQRQRLPADYAVFGGDFNASAGEPCLAEIQKSCDVIDVHEGGKATYPAIWPQRRLDYLLASPGLKVEHVERRKSFGSDHCGLIAHLDAPVCA